MPNPYFDGRSDLLYSNESILKRLKVCEEEFKSGHQLALIEAVTICARFQAVIPEWAATALLEGQASLKGGRCKDFNELFGWGELAKDDRSQAARARRRQVRNNKDRVLEKLLHYRVDGGSFNAEEAFQTTANELGVSRRLVESIYKEHGEFLKSTPQKPEGNHGFMDAQMKPPRRHGRKILED